MNNEYALASKLPLDTLEEIFLVCLSPLERSFRYRLQHLLSWIHVCRNWRYIALNIPRLWTHIDIANTNLTREFIARSGNALVHLTSSSHSPKYADELRLVTMRIQSINSTLDPESLKGLFNIIGPDLPCLDDLNLKTSYPSYFTGISHPSSLRKLSLERLSLPWKDYFGLSQLTHFYLRDYYPRFDNWCGPSFDEIFTILEGAPRLEHLTLGHLCIPDLPPTRAAVSLPNLRKLSIDDNHSVIRAILQCLILPPQTQTHIECFSFDINGILGWSSLIQEKAAHLHYMAMNKTRIQLFKSAAATSQETDPIITIIWPIGSCFDFLAAIHTFFDFSQITTFKVMYSGSTDHICEKLCSMPNLENLILRSGISTLERVFAVLWNDTIEGIEYNLPPHTGLLCPQLRSISISLFSPEWLEKQHYDSIIVVAKVRHDAAMPLDTLEFRMTRKLLGGFRKEVEQYVDKVIVQF